MADPPRHLLPSPAAGLLALFLLVPFPACALPGEPPGLHPLYPGDQSFEARFIAAEGSSFFLRGKGPNRFILVRTDPGARWPGVHFHPPGRAWDLSGQSALLAVVRNEGKKKALLSLRADCAKKGRKETFLQANRHVGPGETALLFLPLLPYYPEGKNLSFPGMRGKPLFSTNFDPSWVTKVLLFITGKEKRRRFSILSLSVADWNGTRDHLPPPEKFFPFIDEFGQYMHREWPGKTHSLEEMKNRLAAEEKDLASHPVPPGRDIFGGCIDGPSFGAEGRFRPVKYRGRWWLLDPEGKLFWSFGVDCVGLHAATPVSRRERFFSFLPGGKSPQAAFYGKSSLAPFGFYAGKTPYRTFDFAGLNLSRKFGASWREKAVSFTLLRIKSWGFNTLGNWSAREVMKRRKVPYVVPIHYWSPRIEGSAGMWGKFPDVFHPGFRRAVRARLSLEKGRSARDPWCIGYFVDNELSWGSRTYLATACLKSPATQPAKRALLEFLEKKYGKIEKLNLAWKSRYASWKDFQEGAAAPTGRRAISDLSSFAGKIYETYFRTIRDEIHRIAPGRLYLGCRFSVANPDAVRAAAEYCDVLSFNWYTFSVAGKGLPPGVDKPVIIGEFHFGALDRGLFHPGLVPAPNQEYRARLFRSYLEGALKNPMIVGAHWFQYRDEATTGRFDGENFQIGLVDVCDTPYPEMVQAARLIGKDLYKIRDPGIPLRKDR